MIKFDVERAYKAISCEAQKIVDGMMRGFTRPRKLSAEELRKIESVGKVANQVAKNLGSMGRAFRRFAEVERNRKVLRCYYWFIFGHFYIDRLYRQKRYRAGFFRLPDPYDKEPSTVAFTIRRANHEA